MRKGTVSELNHLSDIEKIAVSRLIHKIMEKISLAKVVLFGSKARGDFKEFSDIDLLLLIQDNPLDIKSEIFNFELEVNIEMDTLLSSKVYNIEDWNRKDNIFPIFLNAVEREGIEIEI